MGIYVNLKELKGMKTEAKQRLKRWVDGGFPTNLIDIAKTEIKILDKQIKESSKSGKKRIYLKDWLRVH